MIILFLNFSYEIHMIPMLQHHFAFSIFARLGISSFQTTLVGVSGHLWLYIWYRSVTGFVCLGYLVFKESSITKHITFSNLIMTNEFTIKMISKNKYLITVITVTVIFQRNIGIREYCAN